MSLLVFEQFQFGYRERFGLETDPFAATAYVKPSVENADRFPSVKMLNRRWFKGSFHLNRITPRITRHFDSS